MENITFLIIISSFLLNSIYAIVNIPQKPYWTNDNELRWETSSFHIIMFLLTVAAFLAYGWETISLHSYSNNFFYNY